MILYKTMVRSGIQRRNGKRTRKSLPIPIAHHGCSWDDFTVLQAAEPKSIVQKDPYTHVFGKVGLVFNT